MVSNLVSNAEPPACATPPPRDAVYEPDLRLVAGVRKLAVCGCEWLCLQLLLSRVRGLGVDATSTRELPLIYYPFSLKKRDKSVGSVGCVGKSQKSPEISQ